MYQTGVCNLFHFTTVNDQLDHHHQISYFHQNYLSCPVMNTSSHLISSLIIVLIKEHTTLALPDQEKKCNLPYIKHWKYWLPVRQGLLKETTHV